MGNPKQLSKNTQATNGNKGTKVANPPAKVQSTNQSSQKSLPKGKQAAVQPDSEDEEDETEEDESGSDNIDISDDDDIEDDEEDDDEEDDDDGEEASEEDDEDGEDDDSAGFEVQSSSDESIADTDDSEASDAEEENNLREVEARKRFYEVGVNRAKAYERAKQTGELQAQQILDVDDLSSDDEEAANRNTIGRVPLHWYDAFDHIGYSIDGKKIIKRPQKDRLDLAIENRDDPMALRRIYDMYNDREVVISERELEIIRRMQAGAFAHPEFNDTPEYVDYFSSQKEIMPLSAAPEHKANFVPSKWEMMKVLKIAKAMKEGRYKMQSEKQNKEDDENKDNYLIWDDLEDDVLAESKRFKYHLPAPKMPLPGHAESYNPPAEYLLTEEEKEKFLDLDPEDRPYNFIPKGHACLRHVGAYPDFVKERYERCLDLYLCPRKMKKRLNIDPETLVPKLPSPKELKPFPNALALQFVGHTGAVRCIAVSPDGQYMVSGGDDGTVRLWEVDSCYCRYVWRLEEGPILSIAWNPDPSHQLLAVATGKKLILIATGTGDADSLDVTESQLAGVIALAKGKNIANKDDDDSEEENTMMDDDDEEGGKRKKHTVTWKLREDNTPIANKGVTVGPRVEFSLENPVSYVSWHHKGDYLAVLSPNSGAKTISIHQISKGQSQFPFGKTPGIVSTVAFHPFLPCLFVVTQQHVKLYHLVEQKMIKKLLSGCKWLSSMDIHTSGDHIILGSYDRRVIWFDLDLASTPYKTLKFHEKAVRDVKYHRRYPLMASASDDGTVHIFHCTVYSDLSKNPMIVPLKVLKGHGITGDLGVLSILFHPRQPWVFTAGADGLINLYQDI